MSIRAMTAHFLAKVLSMKLFGHVVIFSNRAKIRTKLVREYFYSQVLIILTGAEKIFKLKLYTMPIDLVVVKLR
jgi:hypothetical protein